MTKPYASISQKHIPPPRSHKRFIENTAAKLLALSGKASLRERQESLSIRVRGEVEAMNKALDCGEFNMMARRSFVLRKPVRRLRTTLLALKSPNPLPPRWSQMVSASPKEGALDAISHWAHLIDASLVLEGF